MLSPDIAPSPRALKLFGLVGLPLACLVGGVALWLGPGLLIAALVMWVGAAVSLALALLRPHALRPVWVGLAILTFPIAWSISHIVLGTAFFAVLMPIALAMRAFGRDPLDTRNRARGTSRWRERPSSTEPERYFRPF